MVPKALNLMIIPIIFYLYQHCMTIIDKYHSKLKYRTKQFMETIYYSQKQVENKLNWQNKG